MADFHKHRLIRIMEPTTEPITLAEAKLYLRVDFAEDDMMISTMITAARQMAEDYLRRSLALQTWRISYSRFVPSTVTLPMGGIQTVTTIQKIDADNQTETLDASLYVTDKTTDEVRFIQSISAHQITITYQAGYNASGDIPASLRQGILDHIAALYEGRSVTGGLPNSSRALYQPYKKISL